MSSWRQLDAYLGDLTHRLGGQAYVFSDAGNLQLSPPTLHAAERLAGFDRACATVRSTFGPDCLHSGKWRRHQHHEPNNWFVAEKVLTSYHFIVLFDEEYVNDEWIAATLDHARPVLAELIPGLPPLDGGGRSAAEAAAEGPET
jgi:hypothetical protein